MSTRYFDTAHSFSYNVITSDDALLIHSTQNAIFNSQYSMQARIVAFEAKQNTVLTGDGDDVVVDFAGSFNAYDIRGGKDSFTFIGAQDVTVYAYAATGEKEIYGATSEVNIEIGNDLQYSATQSGRDVLLSIVNPYDGGNVRATLKLLGVDEADSPTINGRAICVRLGDTPEPEQVPFVSSGDDVPTPPVVDRADDPELFILNPQSSIPSDPIPVDPTSTPTIAPQLFEG